MLELSLHPLIYVVEWSQTPFVVLVFYEWEWLWDEHADKAVSVCLDLAWKYTHYSAVVLVASFSKLEGALC